MFLIGWSGFGVFIAILLIAIFLIQMIADGSLGSRRENQEICYGRLFDGLEDIQANMSGLHRRKIKGPHKPTMRMKRIIRGRRMVGLLPGHTCVLFMSATRAFTSANARLFPPERKG